MFFWGLLMFLISITIFIFCKNLMLIWMMLFLNTLASLFFILNEENQNLMKYFLIQEMGSICIIFGYIHFHLFFMLGVFLKVGCFPFHSWIINLIFSVEKNGLIWIWSISKIIPLFIFVSFMEKINILFIFFLMLLNQIFLFFNKNFKLLMFFSSLTNFFWMIFFSMFYLFLSMMFYFIYNFFIFLLFPLIEWKSKQMNFLFVFHLSGLPLSLLFFMKIFILLYLFNFSFSLLMIFFFFTISIIFNYFKVVELEMMNSMIFLNLNSFWNMILFLMMYNFLIFFFLM